MSASRRIGVLAATGIGVGSMLGSGVFSDLWVDVLATGSWFIAVIGLAALVALANALSTAQLAARYPVAGGAYAYGRAELGHTAGMIAGASFVVGKTVSVAVAATVLGTYLVPGYAPLIATGAVLASWALNARGITKTAAGATVIAITVSAALVALSIGALTTTPATSSVTALTLAPENHGLAAGAFLTAVAATFFAFAGYARIATLGEDVRRPEVTIPRAVMIALGVVTAVYLLVGTALHRSVGDDENLGEAPMHVLGDVAGIPAVVVTAVAALSVFGAMLAVMAGAGRTAMAMARAGDLPRGLAVQGSTGAPWKAEAAVAAAAIALVWLPGVNLILVSVATILTYYAVANLAAAQQRRARRTASLSLPVAVPVAGLAASVVLALVALASAFDVGWPALVLVAVMAAWILVAVRRGRAAAD